MGRLAYLAVLAGCLIATAPLEVLLRTRVYARWRRLALSVAPVLAVFVAWDLYAIARGHWDFDPRRTTGVLLPGGLPLDELLFFVVVPVCAVLALEAVRVVTGWRAGDEPAEPAAPMAEPAAPMAEPAAPMVEPSAPVESAASTVEAADAPQGRPGSRPGGPR